MCVYQAFLSSIFLGPFSHPYMQRSAAFWYIKLLTQKTHIPLNLLFLESKLFYNLPRSISLIGSPMQKENSWPSGKAQGDWHEPFLLPCHCWWLLRAPMGLKACQRPCTWAKGWLVPQERHFRVELDALDKGEALLATNWPWKMLNWGQPHRRLRLASPQTQQSEDNLRAAANGWWTAADHSMPFKSTPACPAGKLPISSSHKQSCFGRIKGGGECGNVFKSSLITCRPQAWKAGTSHWVIEEWPY